MVAAKACVCPGPLAKQLVIIPEKDVDIVLARAQVAHDDFSETDETSEDDAHIETIYASEDESEMRTQQGKDLKRQHAAAIERFDRGTWQTKRVHAASALTVSEPDMESAMKQAVEPGSLMSGGTTTVVYSSWKHLKRQHAADIERFDRNMAKRGHAASALTDSESDVEPP